MTIILSLNSQQENLKAVLNAQVKIQKNILLSLYQLQKEHDNGKTAKKQHGNGKTAKKQHDNCKTAKKQDNNAKTAKKEYDNGKTAKKCKATI